MHGEPSGSRFFTDFYDSVHQGAYPDLKGALGEILDRAFVGRLRFDTMLSRTLCLIDTQVLDGEFFLSLGPLRLNDLLKRQDVGLMPIEVMSRANSLEGALVGFIRKEGDDYLTLSTRSPLPRWRLARSRLAHSDSGLHHDCSMLPTVGLRSPLVEDTLRLSDMVSDLLA